MKDENNLYWVWLAERIGVASKNFTRIAEKYDDPYDVYRLENEEIEQLDGVSARLKEKLCDKSLESAYSILQSCKKNGIDIIGYGDGRYPSRLKTIEDPPVLLYCMGRLPDIDSRLCVGMVGTRKMSEYGKQSAYKISYELGAANVLVVSGMALGIDGVCACGALEAGKDTVAVLGCGLCVVYPREHERLMRAIAKHGAVISEYPPFERPNPQNFPKRNRIISCLCQGVLIVEGARGSGALITASRAISQGRELFALPGKINESNSEGPNELIKNGANVALSSEDIINHYDFLYHDTISYRGLSKAKRSVLDCERALQKYGVSSVYYRGRYIPSEDKPESVVTVDVSETQAKTAVPAVPDNSEKILSELDSGTQRIFSLIPDGTAFTPDAVSAHGIDISEVITALTVLEISGLVSSLPGGSYIKK